MPVWRRWCWVCSRLAPATRNPNTAVWRTSSNTCCSKDGRRSAFAISEEIEAKGGYLNAYTSRESGLLRAKLSKDTALGMDVLADILQFSALKTISSASAR